MLATIKNTIEKHGMACAGDKIIVALSGGADSVCLLYALLESGDVYAIEACHINHRLRGEDSDNDEQFVRNLCERLDVPLHVRAVDIKAQQKKHQSLEEAAREARYEYFGEISENALIATAHTADDNAETVLLNLIRGTALRGLCGIPPVRGNIIRPLLETPKTEILACLEAKNAQYVTDQSNFSEEFTRNNLRLNVIPELFKINPSLNAGMIRMCEALRRDEDYLHEIALSALDKARNSSGGYDVSALKIEPPAILFRIISLILSQNNISPSFLTISSIISILDGGKVNLAKNKFAVVSENNLRVEIIHQNYRKN